MSSDCDDGYKCENMKCIKETGVVQPTSKSFLQRGADCSCTPDDCDPGVDRGGTNAVPLACVDDAQLQRMVCVTVCEDNGCPDGEQCEDLGSFSACFPPPEEPKESPGCTKDSDCKSGYVCTDYFGKQCRLACEPVKSGDEECSSDDDCKTPMTCKENQDGMKVCTDPNPCDAIKNSLCYEVPGAGGGNVTACMVSAKRGEACGNGNGKGGNATQLCKTSDLCVLDNDWSGICRETCRSDSDCGDGWECKEAGDSKACVPTSQSASCSRD
jgi:hypothetical protein